MALNLYRLRNVRENRGLSQQELADRAGIARDGISRYESGACDARPSTASKLAEALDVEVVDLTNGGKVEVLVGKIDDDGIDQREVFHFTARRLAHLELRNMYPGVDGYMELYDCSDGYRVFVDHEDEVKGSFLNPEASGYYDELYTADEIADEYPEFASLVGRRRVRDID